MAIIRAIAERHLGTSLRALAKEPIECLDGSQDIRDVLEKLARDEERIFAVFTEGRFVGVITFNHIVEYLLLHQTETTDSISLKTLVGLMH
jgi:hypothetical protein